MNDTVSCTRTVLKTYNFDELNERVKINIDDIFENAVVNQMKAAGVSLKYYDSVKLDEADVAVHNRTHGVCVICLLWYVFARCVARELTYKVNMSTLAVQMLYIVAVILPARRAACPLSCAEFYAFVVRLEFFVYGDGEYF